MPCENTTRRGTNLYVLITTAVIVAVLKGEFFRLNQGRPKLVDREKSSSGVLTTAKPARTVQSSCRSAQFNHTSERLLVVIFGLMRTYERNWPEMKLVTSSFDTEILVSTDPTVQCQGQVCATGTPGYTEEEFRKQIERIYGATTHVYFTNKYRSEFRIPPLIAARSSELNLTRENYLKRFNILLALRPDVLFTTHACFFDIGEVCQTHHGFNLISGTIVRDCFWHKRDWNFGFLACQPLSLLEYYKPSLTCQNSWPGCNTTEPTIPTLPPDFTGSWYTPCGAPKPVLNQSDLGRRLCKHGYCDRVVTFQLNHERLGTIDDVTYLQLMRGE